MTDGSTPLPAIIGGTVGGSILLIIIVIVLVIVCVGVSYHRKQKRQDQVEVSYTLQYININSIFCSNLLLLIHSKKHRMNLSLWQYNMGLRL